MTVLQIKAMVRFRDGYRCVDCGMTNEEHLERNRKRLDVHRKIPNSPYTVDGCMTLCRKCHKRKHGRSRLDPGRVRMIVDTDDVIRRAVKLRALKMSRPSKPVSYSDVVNSILRAALTREIDEVSGYVDHDDPDHKPRRRRDNGA